MKVSFIVLSLFLLTNISTARTFDVNGAKAEALVKALTNINAKAETKVEHSLWEVYDVDVNYTPRGFNPSSGKLVDRNNNRTEMSFAGANALDLYTALKKIGLRATFRPNPTPEYRILAKRIECQTGVSPFKGVFHYVCKIEQR